MADCGLNAKGIDQVCYDIYGPGGSNDAHSVTGYNTFITPIHGKILEIEDMDTGKKIVFGHEQKIQIKRNGTPMEVLGKDFKETDEFVSY
jgi:hypothetical protein